MHSSCVYGLQPHSHVSGSVIVCPLEHAGHVLHGSVGVPACTCPAGVWSQQKMSFLLIFGGRQSSQTHVSGLTACPSIGHESRHCTGPPASGVQALRMLGQSQRQLLLSSSSGSAQSSAKSGHSHSQFMSSRSKLPGQAVLRFGHSHAHVSAFCAVRFANMAPVGGQVFGH